MKISGRSEKNDREWRWIIINVKLYNNLKESAKEGRYDISTQTKGGWYEMTMPITDRTQIEYLLRGCDINEVKYVLKSVMHENWVI